MAKKFKIKKGDKVAVTTGRDKGKTGEVVRVLRKDDRVLVQGVNLVKRHTAAEPGLGGWHYRKGSADPHLQRGPYRSEVEVADPCRPAGRKGRP